MPAGKPTINITIGGGTGPIELEGQHGQVISYSEYSLVNGEDPDGTSVHLVVANDPQQGTVTLVDGNVEYTPTDSSYVGADSFSLKYVDDDGEESAAVTVNIELTNTPPYLAVINGSDPLTATFSSPHDAEFEQDESYLLISDSDSAAPTLSIVDDPTHGTLDFNTTTGAFTYTPEALYVGPDSFTFTANDGLLNGASLQTITVQLNTTNAEPDLDIDYAYSIHSSTVRVSIADLLANDSDADDPIDPATFQILPQSSAELTIVRDGDDLLITPNYRPAYESADRAHRVYYSVTDRVGASGLGTLKVINVPMTLKQGWLETLDEQEAVHRQYRYYSPLGIDVAFAQLRAAAEQATYVTGNVGTANATYDPFSDTVTLEFGITTMDPTTVIHESVHAYDDMFGHWYLSSYSSLLRDIDKAERLAWAGQNFLTATAGPLVSLQSFENYAFGPVAHTSAEISQRWFFVVATWASMHEETYDTSGWSTIYTQNPWTYEIGNEGWADFFTKFGINGLSSVASVYETLRPGVVLTRVIAEPNNPTIIKEVPLELW